METVCMKCQILFYGKNKKNISKCLLKILPRAHLLKPNDVVSFHVVKTLIIKYGIYTNIFAENKCEQLLHLQKLLTFLQQKYLWIRYCTY